MHNSCKNKSKLLELVDDGIIDAHAMLVSCVAYMSEADVADMLHCEGYLDADDDDNDDDDDDDDDDNDDDDDD